MSFLRDEEIRTLIRHGGVIGLGESPEDPYSLNAQVQPSSIDIRMRNIYLPETKPKDKGGLQSPSREHYLNPGETAIVDTIEEFRLPREIAGIGFPPAHVSQNGLLMTNAGHIDPGYHGRLSFTLVNMGREHFHLLHGERICTVLLFRIALPPERDFTGRGGLPSEVKQDTLDKLSLDFLNITSRAESSATKHVRNAELRSPLWAGLFTIVVFGLGVLANYCAIKPDLEEQIGDVRHTVELLDSNIQTDDRLDDLDNRLRQIESTSTEDMQ